MSEKTLIKHFTAVTNADDIVCSVHEVGTMLLPNFYVLPSISGLHCLLNICGDYAAEHEIIFNCHTYMGVQKEWKSTFLTAFEHREKEARSLFAAHYWYRSCFWMSLSSESSVSNTIPRCLYWLIDFTFWPPNINNIGVARGEEGQCPLKIFRKHSHFGLWGAFFQTE